MRETIAVKQIAVYDRWIFVVDGAGDLWVKSVFAAVEGYMQPVDWQQIKLPTVGEANGDSR